MWITYVTYRHKLPPGRRLYRTPKSTKHRHQDVLLVLMFIPTQRKPKLTLINICYTFPSFSAPFIFFFLFSLSFLLLPPSSSSFFTRMKSESLEEGMRMAQTLILMYGAFCQGVTSSNWESTVPIPSLLPKLESVSLVQCVLPTCSCSPPSSRTEMSSVVFPPLLESGDGEAGFLIARQTVWWCKALVGQQSCSSTSFLHGFDGGFDSPRLGTNNSVSPPAMTPTRALRRASKSIDRSGPNHAASLMQHRDPSGRPIGPSQHGGPRAASFGKSAPCIRTNKVASRWKAPPSRPRHRRAPL